MSLYWYAYCDTHKLRCEAGDSHSDQAIRLEPSLGLFLRQHSQCGVKLCCDPDDVSDPEYFECEEWKP